MDIGFIVLLGLFLFFIIFGAVRSAIDPLINHKEDENSINTLNSLREIGILDSEEYNDIKKTLQNINKIKTNQIIFNEQSKLLDELKEIGKLTEIEYENKIKKLKVHFKGE